MRIAIVSPVFPPYRGGIGTVAAHDAELLRAAGDYVEVFTPQYRSPSPREQGITRFRPFYAWGNAAVLFQLLSALRNFDVIHLHYPFFGSDILAAFAAKRWAISLVLSYHMRPKAKGLLGLTFAAYRAVLQPIIFSVASTVLVASEEYANEHGVKHRNRRVLPFGVDTRRFSPGDRLVACERFGLPQDIPVVVFVGGLDAAHYFKGVDVLLDAFAIMKSTAHLLIVGDGNQRSAFEERARLLGIANRVHFAGSVPFEALPEAYRAADVHVLPSIDRSEAFGIVTEEAMATGIPSVVSDLPGVRSLVIPEATGLRVPPGDPVALAAALDRICADPSRTKVWGVQARLRAEREFSADVLAKRLREMYRKLQSHR